MDGEEEELLICQMIADDERNVLRDWFATWATVLPESKVEENLGEFVSNRSVQVSLSLTRRTN